MGKYFWFYVVLQSLILLLIYQVYNTKKQLEFEVEGVRERSRRGEGRREGEYEREVNYCVKREHLERLREAHRGIGKTLEEIRKRDEEENWMLL